MVLSKILADMRLRDAGKSTDYLDIKWNMGELIAT